MTTSTITEPVQKEIYKIRFTNIVGATKPSSINITADLLTVCKHFGTFINTPIWNSKESQTKMITIDIPIVQEAVKEYFDWLRYYRDFHDPIKSIIMFIGNSGQELYEKYNVHKKEIENEMNKNSITSGYKIISFLEWYLINHYNGMTVKEFDQIKQNSFVMPLTVYLTDTFKLADYLGDNEFIEHANIDLSPDKLPDNFPDCVSDVIYVKYIESYFKHIININSDWYHKLYTFITCNPKLATLAWTSSPHNRIACEFGVPLNKITKISNCETIEEIGKNLNRWCNGQLDTGLQDYLKADGELNQLYNKLRSMASLYYSEKSKYIDRNRYYGYFNQEVKDLVEEGSTLRSRIDTRTALLTKKYQSKKAKSTIKMRPINAKWYA